MILKSMAYRCQRLLNERNVLISRLLDVGWSLLILETTKTGLGCSEDGCTRPTDTPWALILCELCLRRPLTWFFTETNLKSKCDLSPLVAIYLHHFCSIHRCALIYYKCYMMAWQRGVFQHSCRVGEAGVWLKESRASWWPEGRAASWRPRRSVTTICIP